MGADCSLRELMKREATLHRLLSRGLREKGPMRYRPRSRAPRSSAVEGEDAAMQLLIFPRCSQNERMRHREPSHKRHVQKVPSVTLLLLPSTSHPFNNLQQPLDPGSLDRAFPDVAVHRRCSHMHVIITLPVPHMTPQHQMVYTVINVLYVPVRRITRSLSDLISFLLSWQEWSEREPPMNINNLMC